MLVPAVVSVDVLDIEIALSPISELDNVIVACVVARFIYLFVLLITIMNRLK